MRRRPFKIGAALIAVVLLAACGSSAQSSGASSASSETTAAPSTEPLPGVTDTEVHVAGFYTSGAFGDGEAAARARFQRANDAGGVNGRQIVLDQMFDDAGDPNTSLQQVQEVVNGGHTLAAVPVLTASMNGFNTLNDAGMPFFGWGITTGYCGPMAFSFSGAVCEKATEGNNTMAILAQALPNNGKDARVAIIAQEDQSAREAARRAADAWTVLGAKVVLQQASVPSPPAVVSDWTPYATSIIDSGADFALLPLSAINTIGLASKLKELGFKGTIATFVMYDPRIAALAKDTLVVLSTAPWEQTDAPGIAQAIADLKKYAPDTALNLPSLAGWLAADQFVSLLASAGPELNRGTFNAAIKSFTYDFGGAAGPVRNPDTQEHLSGCNSVVRGTGTGYEVVVRYTCLPLIPF